MTNDEILRSAARIVRADPGLFMGFLRALLPRELSVAELRTIRSTVRDASDYFRIEVNRAIEAVQAACEHDWEDRGGHDYLQIVCRKCEKEEWR